MKLTRRRRALARSGNRSVAVAARLGVAAFVTGYVFHVFPASTALGIFEGRSDVGQVQQAGSAEYDAATKTYTVTGSGANMWFAEDDFHFVWKKVSAKDISLAADIELLGTDGDDHRKGVLMIRQNLDADAPYADAALHGDGLTALQFRDEKGAATHEVESNVCGPKRLRIEKRGSLFYLWIGDSEQNMQFAGGSARVRLKSPFFIGLGVCAHNKDAVQKAAFRNVHLSTMPAVVHGRYSTLETVAVASTDARVVYVSKEVLGAPWWSEDGDFLIFRSGEQVERIPASGGTPEPLAAPPETQNQASRTSPDGKQTASLLDGKPNMLITVTEGFARSSKVIAKLPDGGELSQQPWSPDGKKLAFVSYQRPEKR